MRVIVEVGLRVGISRRVASRGVIDAPGALAALNAMEQALAAASPALPGDPGMLLDLRSARADVLAYELARQRSMLPMLAHGLARLRAAGTIDDLVESIPIHTVALGYERAMFSWVDHERWVPRSMYTLSGPREAQAILAAGAPPYLHTRDLLEVDVVRNRRPILVLDAATNPRVHPKIAPVSRSHTYVAAPVVARGHVVGFVHLDRNANTGTTDEFDRDLLAFFCEGIGAMLDRLLVTGDPVSPAVPNPPLEGWVDVLTTREREVLRLVAAGLTNSQIGARLFISEETTKTHVKKLLRKLGVTNRAQAGALFHGLRSVRAS
jgi:DNA-binding CsgD family transcriptional regulator